MSVQSSSAMALSENNVALAKALLDANPLAIRDVHIGPELRRAYQQAAAVLVSIQDLELLKPVDLPSEVASAERALRDDIERVSTRSVSGRWVLKTAVRRKTIAELTSSESINRALASNPSERSGRMQTMYERLLLGETPDLEKMTGTELEEIVQLLTWLVGVRPIDASLVEARQRLDRLRLLAPFEALAGDSIFQGRTAEMDQLRSHVGVLSPKLLWNQIKQTVSNVFNFDTRYPALSLYGPGGVGKSALVARFALEHLRLPRPIRIPFAYLDFDRADRDVGNLTALAAEVIRQVRVQWPELGELNLLWQEAQARVLALSQDPASVLAPNDVGSNETEANYVGSDPANLLSKLFRILEGANAAKPFVLVLDSFEEVQYRDEARAYPLWDVLQRARSNWPWVQVVISGRAPVSSLRLDNQPPAQLALGELDANAAVAFLRNEGVHDEKTANAIVGIVGGVPLSLKLAATLLKDNAGSRTEKFSGVKGRRKFWISATDEVIQGQLYERILGHLHDERVRRLAHPGLVLRRVSPPIIRYVLNEPCGLAVRDDSDANELFDALRRETSLVTADDLEGALVHRSDLRRVMLKLIILKMPALVTQIHLAAINWYRSQPGQRARAEETYHRLQIGDDIKGGVLDDPEVRSSIQASVADFSPQAQQRLLALGIIVEESVLRSATARDRDSFLIAQAERQLPYGSSAEAQTYDQVLSWIEKSESPTRLFILAARVAGQRGDKKAQLQWLARAQERLAVEDDMEAALELLSERCWALRVPKKASREELQQYLEQLGDYAARLNKRWAIAQHQAQEIQLNDDTRNLDEGSQLRVAAELLAQLDSRELWQLVPAWGRVVDKLARADPSLWSKVCTKLAESDGVFARAQPSNREAHLAIQRLVGLSKDYVHEGSPSPDVTTQLSLEQQVSSTVRQLTSSWPYQILRVEPPYGSGGRNLTESA